MVKRVQIVRHSTTALADAFTGLVGEMSADLEKDEMRLHDAVVAGGFPILREDLANIRSLPAFRTTIELNTNWDLKSISDLSSNGIPVRTGAATASARSIAGAANEITLTNGDGVAGNPTVSLPSSLTFTGKTITDGLFNGITIGVGAILSGGLSGTGSANFSGMTLTFANDQISGNAIDGGDISGILTLSGASVTVTNNLVVNGMLTASSISGPIGGTSDSFFIIDSDVTGAPTVDGGIEVERGTDPNARMYFKHAVKKWFADDGTTELEISAAPDAIPKPNNRRLSYWAANSVLTIAGQAIGDEFAATGIPSAIAPGSSSPRYLSFATGAVVGDDAGIEGDLTYRGGRSARLQARVGFTTTNQRNAVGITNQTLVTMVGSDNPAGDYAYFRFSTDAGDTTWQAITKDGTTQTITNTTTTPSNNTQALEISIDDVAGEVIFKVAGIVVATHTTNLPRANLNYRIISGVETRTTSGKLAICAFFYIESDF